MDCTGTPVAEFRWYEGHEGEQIGNYCESCLATMEGGVNGTTVRYRPASPLIELAEELEGLAAEADRFHREACVGLAEVEAGRCAAFAKAAQLARDYASRATEGESAGS